MASALLTSSALMFNITAVIPTLRCSVLPPLLRRVACLVTAMVDLQLDRLKADCI